MTEHELPQPSLVDQILTRQEKLPPTYLEADDYSGGMAGGNFTEIATIPDMATIEIMEERGIFEGLQHGLRPVDLLNIKSILSAAAKGRTNTTSGSLDPKG